MEDEVQNVWDNPIKVLNENEVSHPMYNFSELKKNDSEIKIIEYLPESNSETDISYDISSDNTYLKISYLQNHILTLTVQFLSEPLPEPITAEISVSKESVNYSAEVIDSMCLEIFTSYDGFRLTPNYKKYFQARYQLQDKTGNFQLIFEVTSLKNINTSLIIEDKYSTPSITAETSNIKNLTVKNINTHNLKTYNFDSVVFSAVNMESEVVNIKNYMRFKKQLSVKEDTYKFSAITYDNKYSENIRQVLSYMPYAEIMFISAKTGQRLPKLYETIDMVMENHALRVATGVLNEIMMEAVAMQQPPTDKGKRLKLFYITQVSVKPPTFVIFVNDKELMHFSYTRYIENRIRDAFGFKGTPLHFIIRERKENS
jgi:hypothetical protein